MVKVAFLKMVQCRKISDMKFILVDDDTRSIDVVKSIISDTLFSYNIDYEIIVYNKCTKKLKQEYRSFKIKNFLMFYTVNEKDKIITIVRILYQKMDMNNILEN